MRAIPSTAKTAALARRRVRFGPPVQAISTPVRSMAYVMAYATPKDLGIVRRYVSEAEFTEALDQAPAGIIDARSWAYWNSRAGRHPAPPMPQRGSG